MLLNFLGVTDVHSLICEGHEGASDRDETVLEKAVARAGQFAAEFLDPPGTPLWHCEFSEASYFAELSAGVN